MNNRSWVGQNRSVQEAWGFKKVAGCGLWVAGCGLCVGGYWLCAGGCWLWAVGYWLVAGCWLQMTGEGLGLRGWELVVLVACCVLGYGVWALGVRR